MSTILLVQGDSRTQIKAIITRADTGLPVDLNDTSSVLLRFRKIYTTNTLFTLTAVEAAAGDYASGEATFIFSSNNLDVDAGDYEGQVSIVYSSDGSVETVFEVINFIVKKAFT